MIFNQTLTSLLVIAVIASLAPIISDFVSDIAPLLRLPNAVLEIALGIIVGPQVLGIATATDSVQAFSAFGLVFLFFLAGFDIDFALIRGRPLRRAALGWAFSLALALIFSAALWELGVISALLYVWLAMATTTIGTLLPILSDAAVLTTQMGPYILAAGAIGEFGPIVVAAILLNGGRGTFVSVVLLGIFALGALGATSVVWTWRPKRIVYLVARTMHSSAQLALRLSILLLAALVVFAAGLGLDELLGACAAGLIVAHVLKGIGGVHSPDVEELRRKFEGLGFGFFIPIFFIVSGIQFNIRALLDSRISLALAPVFLLMFLAVRGIPALVFYHGVLPRHDQQSLALLCSTQLPLVITITGLGVAAHIMRPATASAMVGAALLSVLIFPLVALSASSRRKRRDGPGQEAQATPAAQPAQDISGNLPAANAVRAAPGVS